MALDKQRILNELGSVMNQLKSADCGCMGKLFGNTAQTPAAVSPMPCYGGCRRNCCYGNGYGWNPSGSHGESFSSNAQNMHGHCMGSCNPPKLYADTYNYLTENLMQPAIKEVYSDLKGLSPANTVMNNPMGSQMGLSKNGFAVHDNTGAFNDQYPTTNQLDVGNINDSNTFNITGQQPNELSMPMQANTNAMGQMGGMGPQIMNMLGNNTSNPKNIIDQNHLSGPLVDTSQYGQEGVTPLSAPLRTNQEAYDVNSLGYLNSYNVNQGTMQPNLPSGQNAQNVEYTIPAAQQMTSGHHNSHGHHSQGVTKFNEMFPGVMKGLGGDLGFDPMAIALQMNPANHQQAAINTMHKMMENNDINKVFDKTANAAALHKGVAPTSNSSKIQPNQINNNIPSNQIQQSNILYQPANEINQLNYTPPSPIAYQTNKNYNKEAANIYASSNAHGNNEQIYQTGLRVPVTNQQSNIQSDQQQAQKYLQYQHESVIDPNTSAITAPPKLPSAYDPVIDTQSSNIKKMIKEPIFPADTSRFTIPKQKYYEYNTLGQPVEMLSAKMYKTIEPGLPQTLSPQPTNKPRSDPSKYSRVKSTVSKTSLMGSKPVGRTPSQLQQIYNQYRGSQSYTQQNIPTPSVNVTTHSEGKIIPPQNDPSKPPMLLEKIGGDTAINNNFQYERANKVEQVIGHIGDVPTASKPAYEGIPDKATPIHNRKCRNGLQDIIYTSYPTSAAWSFHGVTIPYSDGRRYRKH